MKVQGGKTSVKMATEEENDNKDRIGRDSLFKPVKDVNQDFWLQH